MMFLTFGCKAQQRLIFNHISIDQLDIPTLRSNLQAIDATG